VSVEHVDATFYAQVQPEFSRWDNHATGEKDVLRAKVVNLTQQRPEHPRGGTVVVKLTIRVPKAAFLPLRPEAIVVIPEDMTAPYPIEVEAGDPS
jgi:hypothetical protein